MQAATAGDGSKLLCTVAAAVAGEHAGGQRLGLRHLQICGCVSHFGQRLHRPGTHHAGKAALVLGQNPVGTTLWTEFGGPEFMDNTQKFVSIGWTSWGSFQCVTAHCILSHLQT